MTYSKLKTNYSYECNTTVAAPAAEVRRRRRCCCCCCCCCCRWWVVAAGCGGGGGWQWEVGCANEKLSIRRGDAVPPEVWA